MVCHCQLKFQFEMNVEYKVEIANYLKKAFKSSNFENVEAILEDKPYKDFALYMKTKYSSVKLDKLMGRFHPRDLKNNAKSIQLRQDGNNKFKSLKFQESLSLYNRALSFANSDELRVLCFGNISANLLQLGNFRGCLMAISNAKNLHKGDDALLAKLLEREEKCKKLIGEPRIMNKLQLSYPAHPRNPEIVNCIERRPSGGIFAKRNLKATDVIAITKPFINGPNQRNWHSCEHCRAQTIETGVVSCDRCPFALYCSQDCKSDDKLFHSFICCEVYVIALRDEFMALKFTVKMLSNGIDIRKNNFKKPQVTCFDWNSGTLEERVESLCATRTIRIPDQKKFSVLVMYFGFLNRMKESSSFRAFLDRFYNGEELFFKTYWKSFQIIYSFSKTLDISNEKYLESIYVDLLTGFFNHNCVPNVIECRNALTGETHYTIIENIKAGDQIFIAFG